MVFTTQKQFDDLTELYHSEVAEAVESYPKRELRQITLAQPSILEKRLYASPVYRRGFGTPACIGCRSITEFAAAVWELQERWWMEESRWLSFWSE